MLSEPSDKRDEQDDDGGPSFIGLIVAIVSILATTACWLAGWNVAFLVLGVVVISIVIWQACDPFADAAQWIGTTFHVPGSVRGATLDAVASSLPELFTGIFFVVVAFQVGQEGTEQGEASGEGYGATVATCAGSAVYNMILIPAIVTLVISFKRRNRPTVDVEDKVIARDGVAFILCELVLIICLFMNNLYWWMAIIFMAMYVTYILLLYVDWKRFEVIKHAFLEMGLNTDPREVRDKLSGGGRVFGLPSVQQVQAELQRGNSNGDEEEEDSAGVFFNFFEVPLGMVSSFSVIAISTAVAAAACYFLVEVTRDLAFQLDVPTFFVAVIVAAAASSVPDTFISIGAARRGDDSGAVSNAFGSNIFDICICLSVPLLINSYLNSWNPISLMEDGKPMAGLVGLRLLLGVLTVVTLAIMWHNRQLTRTKAIVLCTLYGVFLAYAILGSLGIVTV